MLKGTGYFIHLLTHFVKKNEKPFFDEMNSIQSFSRFD